MHVESNKMDSVALQAHQASRALADALKQTNSLWPAKHQTQLECNAVMAIADSLKSISTDIPAVTSDLMVVAREANTLRDRLNNSITNEKTTCCFSNLNRLLKPLPSFDQTFTRLATDTCGALTNRVLQLEQENLHLRHQQKISNIIDKDMLDQLSLLCSQGSIFRYGHGCPRDPVRALDCFLLAAEEGSYEAMTLAAEMLLSGEVSSMKTSYLADSASGGWLGSKQATGGAGVDPRDVIVQSLVNRSHEGRTFLSEQRRKQQARVLLERAVDVGRHPPAMVRLAEMCEKAEGGLVVDEAQILALLSAAAERNDGEGLAAMGFLYEHGHPRITQDVQKAMHLYEESIKVSSNPRAMTNLGSLLLSQYKLHSNVPSSTDAEAGAVGGNQVKNHWSWAPPVAVELFKAATATSSPSLGPAFYNLGVCLETALGVHAQDTIGAIRAYKQAAKLGHVPAMAALGGLLLKLAVNAGAGGFQTRKTGTNLRPISTTLRSTVNISGGSQKLLEMEAAHWLRCAVDGVAADLDLLFGEEIDNQGDIGFGDLLGSRTTNKITTSITQSSSYVTAGAGAALQLGCLYQSGVGVTKDVSNALVFFEKAIELANQLPNEGDRVIILGQAHCKAGILLLTSGKEGGVENLMQATRFENSEGINSLGLCLENGAVDYVHIQAMPNVPPAPAECRPPELAPALQLDLAFSCFLWAHQLGCLEGTLNLARFIENGWTIPQRAMPQDLTTMAMHSTNPSNLAHQHDMLARKLREFAAKRGSKAAEVYLATRSNPLSNQTQVMGGGQNGVAGLGHGSLLNHPRAGASWIGNGVLAMHPSANVTNLPPLASVAGLSASPSLSLLAMHQNLMNTASNAVSASGTRGSLDMAATLQIPKRTFQAYSTMNDTAGSTFAHQQTNHAGHAIDPALPVGSPTSTHNNHMNHMQTQFGFGKAGTSTIGANNTSTQVGQTLVGGNVGSRPTTNPSGHPPASSFSPVARNLGPAGSPTETSLGAGEHAHGGDANGPFNLANELVDQNHNFQQSNTFGGNATNNVNSNQLHGHNDRNMQQQQPVSALAISSRTATVGVNGATAGGGKQSLMNSTPSMGNIMSNQQSTDYRDYGNGSSLAGGVNQLSSSYQHQQQMQPMLSN